MLKKQIKKGINKDYTYCIDEINSIKYSETPVNITYICKMLNAAAKVEENSPRPDRPTNHPLVCIRQFTHQMPYSISNWFEYTASAIE